MQLWSKLWPLTPPAIVHSRSFLDPRWLNLTLSLSLALSTSIFFFLLSCLQLCICQRFMDSFRFPIMLHYYTFQVTLSIYTSLIAYLSPLSSQLVSSSSVVFLFILLEVANHSFHTCKSYVGSRAGWLCELCYTWGFLLLFPIYFSRVLFLPPILLLLCLVLCSSPSGNPVVKSGKDWLHERMSAGRSCPWNIQVCLSLSPLPLSPLPFSFSFILSASLLFFLALHSQYWDDSIIWIISWATLIYFCFQHRPYEISLL